MPDDSSTLPETAQHRTRLERSKALAIGFAQLTHAGCSLAYFQFADYLHEKHPRLMSNSTKVASLLWLAADICYGVSGFKYTTLPRAIASGVEFAPSVAGMISQGTENQSPAQQEWKRSPLPGTYGAHISEMARAIALRPRENAEMLQGGVILTSSSFGIVAGINSHRSWEIVGQVAAFVGGAVEGQLIRPDLIQNRFFTGATGRAVETTARIAAVVGTSLGYGPVRPDLLFSKAQSDYAKRDVEAEANAMIRDSFGRRAIRTSGKIFTFACQPAMLLSSFQAKGGFDGWVCASSLLYTTGTRLMAIGQYTRDEIGSRIAERRSQLGDIRSGITAAWRNTQQAYAVE